MLTYRVCHRLGFDFLLGSRLLLLLDVGLFLVLLDGVQLLMCHLMDRSLDRLRLAHTILYGNTILRLMEVSLGPACDIFKSNRDRAGPFQRLEEVLKVLHVALKFCSKSRKLLTVGLGDIEHIYDLERWSLYFDSFFYGFAVLILNGFMSLGIDLISLDLLLVRIPCKDTDRFLALIDVPAKVLLPLCVACNHSCIRLLHRNKDCIIQTVLMKLTHGIKPCHVLIRAEKLLDAGLKLVRDLLDLVATDLLNIRPSFSITVFSIFNLQNL